MTISPHTALFENQPIRRVYDEATETWWFSVVDIVRVLTQQPDATVARKYWNKLKQRLHEEGSQLVTNCHQLKLPASDGKNYLTDVATAETLLRLVQSVPSPKAEPIKLWLARVGYERMREIADPALALERTRETWRKLGRSEKWITQRMTGPCANQRHAQQAHRLLGRSRGQAAAGVRHPPEVAPASRPAVARTSSSAPVKLAPATSSAERRHRSDHPKWSGVPGLKT